MRSLQSRKRAGRLALVAALAIGVPFAVPEGAKGSNNVGTGAVHGGVVFEDPGLSADPAFCTPNLDFSLEALAPGVVYNTVTTGFVGDLEIVGTGISDCGTALGSGGTLTLHVTGTGPTGSQIVCDPLVGGFSRTATAVNVELTGSCTVNDYGTADIRFLSVLNFTPTERDADTGNIFEAIFDGQFVIIPI